MTTWQIGDARITRLQEQEPHWPGTMITANATPDNLNREGEWLKPFFDDKGRILLSIHALLIESEGHRILVDTCVGNDKKRPGFKEWNDLHLPFLAEFDKAGIGRESVDTVICTHLHLDHIGWNTCLREGTWVPTFPNARYLFHRVEYENLANLQPSQGFGLSAAIIDSVQPVIDAGLVDLWDGYYHRVTDDVRLLRMPGHSPAAAIVIVENGGQTAILSGDTVHHPMQIIEPDQRNVLDGDSKVAGTSRRKVLAMAADLDAPLLATHLTGKRAPRIEATADGFAIAGWTPLQDRQPNKKIVSDLKHDGGNPMPDNALRPYLDAINNGDPARLTAVFADDVQLKSPLFAAAVEGKEAASKVRGVIHRAVDTLDLGEVFVGLDGYALALSIEAGDGIHLDGVQYVHLNADGLVDALMVALRPLEGLVALQNRLAPLIGQAPLALTRQPS